jgi:preprotein translocase subunit SecB
MIDKAVLPSSGYLVRDVYAVDQRYQIVTAEPEVEVAERRDVSVSWDWRIIEEGVFEVRLQFDVGPTQEIPEFLAYAVVGTFDAPPESDRQVELSDFVRTHAVTTLIPYVREGLSNLSSRGPFGPYRLPIVNAVGLAENIRFDESTGAKQLAKSAADEGGTSPDGAERENQE